MRIEHFGLGLLLFSFLAGWYCQQPHFGTASSVLTNSRRLSYEFFLFQHIVSAIAYLVFLFLHTRNLFASWFYLWATVAIYAGAIAARTLYTIWWKFGTTQATVSTLVDNAVRVSIGVTTAKGQWRPGQHVFIRFLALAPFQSHPFTIASIEEDGELRLIIKRRKGLTDSLFNKVHQLKEPWRTTVLIDGPYGGVSRDPGSFDTVVLVAGGVGVTFTLPILKDLVRRMQEHGKLRCSNVVFVWTVRSESNLDWLLTEIESCLSPENGVQIKFFVTDGKSSSFASSEKSLVPSMTVEYRRPDLASVFPKVFDDERICVLGAGPEGLIASLNAEVANLQTILIQERRNGEVFLHAETFGV
jgi:predicted ferric reductase